MSLFFCWLLKLIQVVVDRARIVDVVSPSEAEGVFPQVKVDEVDNFSSLTFYQIKASDIGDFKLFNIVRKKVEAIDGISVAKLDIVGIVVREILRGR